MLFFKRLLSFIVLWLIGLLLIKYREHVVRIVGKNDLAEKYLGAGGTYNMWILIGIIAMIVGIFALVGDLSFMGL